jgi:hypothetical protein
MSAQPSTADRYARSVIGHQVPTERERLRMLEQMLDPIDTELVHTT